MIHLYALPVQDAWQDLLPTLPPERQQRALACRNNEAAARITTAGWLLLQVLERHGIPRNKQRFTFNPWGKPMLEDMEQLHFSLSHSDSWTVCAIADHPVGVDAELPRCSGAIARRYFHPQEAVYADDPDSLCRIWTAKEAFVKALGVGLTIPLNSFLICLYENQLQLHQTHTSLPYRLHEYIVDGARICLCCTEEKPELILL